MTGIEIVPTRRDVDEDAADLVRELNALGHDADSKAETGSHAGIALAIRIREEAGGLSELLEQIRQSLEPMRDRRRARGAPREVAGVYGPNGNVLLEVEI